ncbi:hypothetical protein BpHYR1_003105 [Brachionus plicatilis]|uniref:Uncharacterized protein n=1 Tax=Brachionus plicatilis TaxID=10195 RepID=A0A3M7SJJ4_BRAPC|nr:hypothetical protein BpHYR1_003105 [Brachionus plicatilis]
MCENQIRLCLSLKSAELPCWTEFGFLKILQKQASKLDLRRRKTQDYHVGLSLDFENRTIMGMSFSNLGHNLGTRR